jgi:hypothetical protein
MGCGDADLAGICSERDFMDALRVLKARSGLSYREIVARMARADSRHASARSTLAGLLAGNSLPRRPGQLRLLVEVLAAELDEPERVDHYMQAWSRLIAARGNAPLLAMPATPDAPVLSPPAARPGGSMPLYRCLPDPPRSAATPADEAPSRGRRVMVVLLWLVLSLAFYPATYVIGSLFWIIWFGFTIPLLLILFVVGRDGERHPGLREAPNQYLRTEYRASGPAARSGLASRWPG